MPNISLFIRDCILFGVLFMMISHVWMQAQQQGKPIKQRHALSLHEPDNEDLKVLHHIAQLQRKIKAQLLWAKTTEQCHWLQEWLEELDEITDQYTQLSPGTAPLGPISSIFLVFKQQDMQKRIAEIEQQVIKVACS